MPSPLTFVLDIKQDYFSSRWDRATQTKVGRWVWKEKPIITLAPRTAFPLRVT